MPNPEWNPQLGLWQYAHGGHTTPTKNLPHVHSVPNSATRILVALMEGQIDHTQTTAVLQAIRSAQILDSGHFHGCIKWYAEDDGIHDSNAAFFIALSLVSMNGQYRAQLNGTECCILDEILSDLHRWFMAAIGHQQCYYPNKYLGDLCCAWVIAEQAGKDEDLPFIAGHLRTTGQFYHADGWGWGEHMSAIYSTVCCDELSLLLLTAKKLPDDIRTQYMALLNELLSIFYAYDGGTFVPHIRSYAFGGSPTVENYRDRVLPWKTPSTVELGNLPPLGPLFHAMGWHSLVAPRAKRSEEHTVPCFGGSLACASIREHVRFGAMTRYPIMKTADTPAWGLSWQSFPATLWHDSGDWGFWQWETVENGSLRAHPANPLPVPYIPKALNDSTVPPLTGETHSILQKGNALIVRIMPMMSVSWERLTDRFRLIGTHCTVLDGPQAPEAGWRQWLLRFPDAEVSINFVTLAEIASVEQTTHDGTTQGWRDYSPHGRVFHDWNITRDAALLSRQAAVCQGTWMGLWAVSLNGPVMEKPILTPLPATRTPQPLPAAGWRLHWTWPTQTWNVDILPDMPEKLDVRA